MKLIIQLHIIMKIILTLINRIIQAIQKINQKNKILIIYISFKLITKTGNNRNLEILKIVVLLKNKKIKTYQVKILNIKVRILKIMYIRVCKNNKFKINQVKILDIKVKNKMKEIKVVVLFI